MRPKCTSQRGMSMVEATIILMVLAILTAVLAPTINNYVNDARRVKAQEDTEAIGITLVQMLKDMGAPFPLIDPAAALATRYNMANRVELLYSRGNVGAAVGADVATDATAGPVADRNWDDASAAGVEALEDHLVTNAALYTDANPTPSGVQFGIIGWRGPYFTKLAGGDPWGYRYVVSSLYLGWATNADHADGGWDADAIVLSPGPNGRVETAFNHSVGELAADDVGMVISASTR